MPLVTAGVNQLLGIGIGEVLTGFGNANAAIGLGGGAGATTAHAIGQTDLQGASKTRKAMDATYPTRSGNAVTFQATFGTSDANYAVDEIAVFNATSSGVMLSRKVESLGTKTSAATWVVTLTLTVTAG